MHRLAGLALALGLGTLSVAGCGDPRTKIEGPTVNKFTGQLVADGKPVAFNDGDKVILKLMHHTAQSFGIPIKPDGSFDIGEMPIGKYSAQLSIEKAGGDDKKGRRAGALISLPNGFEIKEGQTEYKVELGKNFKP